MTQINIGVNSNSQARNEIKPSNHYLDFDGVDDYVRIDTVAGDSLDLTTTFTVSATFKANSFNSDWDYIVSKNSGGAGSDQQYAIALQSGGTGIYIAWGGIVKSMNYTFETDKWYNISITYDQINLTIYINGEQVFVTPANHSTTFKPYLSFGRRSHSVVNGSQFLFDGIIRDVSIFNTALTASEVRGVYTYELTGNETGLVGYWKLDEGVGETVRDLSSSGKHGTIYGANWDRKEKRENELYFDGVDDYIEANVVLPESFSTSIWIYPNSKNGGAAVIDAWKHGTEYAGLLVRYSGDSYLGILCANGDVGIDATINITTPLKEWTNLVITYDNTEMLFKVYANGEYVDGATGNVFTPAPYKTSLFLGCRKNGATYYFNGKLKNFQVWNRALPEDEVLSIYENGFGKNKSGIFANIDIDEGVGDTVRDSSGYKRHGNIYGATWKKINNKPNAALDFDGVDDYAVINHNGLFDFGKGDFTMQVLCTSDIDKTLGTIFATGGAFRTSYKGVFFSRAGNPPEMYLGVGGTDGSSWGNAFNLSGIWSDYRWFTFTRTSGEVRMYMNDQKHSMSYTLAWDITGSLPMRLGSDAAGSKGKCSIKEFRVWNRALTEAEVFDSHKRDISKNETGLIGLWKLDRGIGDIAIDSSKYENHGTIYGAVWKKERDKL